MSGIIGASGSAGASESEGSNGSAGESGRVRARERERGWDVGSRRERGLWNARSNGMTGGRERTMIFKLFRHP